MLLVVNSRQQTHSMLLWVSFICTECPIGIDEKLFPLCRTTLKLMLDESIKSLHSIASYSVKVTYLGIRSAHERVWLVERKPIWLPQAYLTRGDLEPARGNLHVCKFLRDLTNIQIRTVTAERGGFVLSALPDERVTTQGKKESENRKEREKDGRNENEGESKREGTANEREGESARLNTPWN